MASPYLAKVLLVDTEHEIQLRGVVFQDPLQGVVVFTVLRIKQEDSMHSNLEAVKPYGTVTRGWEEENTCIHTWVL